MEVRREFVVRCLDLSMATDGAKAVFSCQKLVQVLMRDRLTGGRGSINTLLSSSSISSRTAVQNFTRAWMTNICLASGHGPLSLTEALTEEASISRDYLHTAKPLSASSMMLLLKGTPRASVSSVNPVCSNETGLLQGMCPVLMLDPIMAKHNADDPNGSINGLGERGTTTPGRICLDPIATAHFRSMGLEEHEEACVDPEAYLACSLCGKLALSGDCDCEVAERGSKKARRAVNINSSFQKAASFLSSANIDVHVKWKHQQPDSSSQAQPPPQDPEDARWEAVPWHRRDVSMLDLKRRLPSERRPEVPTVVRVKCISPGRCEVVSFGPSDLAKILSKQFEFSMHRLGHSVTWESTDHTDGYCQVSFRDASLEAVYSQALQEASYKFSNLASVLTTAVNHLSLGHLEQLSKVADTDLWMAVEPGGTLHLQTADACAKELLMGLFDYGGFVCRSYRAYLVEDVSLELLPLQNPHYSPLESCNELELRLLLQRHLSYIFLATTLASLPLNREFFRDEVVVQAWLLFDASRSDLCVSDIVAEHEGTLKKLFHADKVLGPNPRKRGWLETGVDRLPVTFLLHRSRADPYPVAWKDVKGLATEIKDSTTGCSQELWRKIDLSLTAFPPALGIRDQRSVYKVWLKKGRELPAASICGHGVFDTIKSVHQARILGGSTGRKRVDSDLQNRSRLYCINCGDCEQSSGEAPPKPTSKALVDIEDTNVPSWLYFSRNDVGDRRKVFEELPLIPSVKVEEQNYWAFRCHTDEDLSCMNPTWESPAPERLEDVPGVAAVLEGIASPSPEQLAAEKNFMRAFFEKTGGAPSQVWTQKAASSLNLLSSAARDLANIFEQLAGSIEISRR